MNFYQYDERNEEVGNCVPEDVGLKMEVSFHVRL